MQIENLRRTTRTARTKVFENIFRHCSDRRQSAYVLSVANQLYDETPSRNFTPNEQHGTIEDLEQREVSLRSTWVPLILQKHINRYFAETYHEVRPEDKTMPWSEVIEVFLALEPMAKDFVFMGMVEKLADLKRKKTPYPIEYHPAFIDRLLARIGRSILV